jgi:MFS family permease
VDRAFAATRWRTVVLLSLLSGLSFLDKLILAVIAAPVAASLSLTDYQLSLLIGPAFAILYAIAGMPVAHLVDNHNRRLILCIGAALWSAATVCSAFAHNFGALAMARSCVALGEAVLMPAAISMFADLFEEHERRRPVSFFFGVTACMSSGAILVGGLIFGLATNLQDILGVAPWRLTLIMVGGPGLLLSLIFYLFTDEPPRRGIRNPTHVEGSGFVDFIRELKEQRRLYAPLFLANAGFGFFIYSMLSWVPTITVRGFGLDPARAGVIVGGTMVPMTLLGIYLWPVLAARIERHRPGVGIATCLLIVSIVAGLPYVIAPVTTSLTVFVVGIAIAAGSTGAFGPLVPMALQSIAPGRMVGRMTALSLLIVNLLGYGLGPVATVVLGKLAIQSNLAGALGMTRESLGLGLGLQGVIAVILMLTGTSLFVAAVRNRAQNSPPLGAQPPLQPTQPGFGARTESGRIA